jgi:hypothetical protein
VASLVRNCDNAEVHTKDIKARNGHAAMVISLDFELYWGVRHLPSVSGYVRDLVGARVAIPAILELFKEYGIHATWATVGFLFCERTGQLQKIAPTRRPLYKNTKLVPYDDLPPDSEQESSESIFFAPSLIHMIAKTANQEVATHSFSHYYCLEEGADIESFRADLHSARRAAWLSNFEVTSLVFPKNQERRDFLDVCAEAGILAYRGNSSSWLYRPLADAEQTALRRLGRLLDTYVPLSGDNCEDWPTVNSGLPVRIPASRFLRPYSPPLGILEPLRLARIKRGLTAAAKKTQLYHLWWHPHNFGRNLSQNCKALRQILDHYRTLQRMYGMESLNMAEVGSRCLGQGSFRSRRTAVRD